jgi:hypothetical protein
LLELPVEELAAILRDERLNASSEQDVWSCALRWIGRDTEGRKVHVPDLLKTVRLGLLARNVFLKEVSTPLIIWKFMCAEAHKTKSFQTFP